jgi:hypothetical protein
LEVGETPGVGVDDFLGSVVEDGEEGFVPVAL